MSCTWWFMLMKCMYISKSNNQAAVDSVSYKSITKFDNHYIFSLIIYIYGQFHGVGCTFFTTFQNFPSIYWKSRNTLLCFNMANVPFTRIVCRDMLKLRFFYLFFDKDTLIALVSDVRSQIEEIYPFIFFFKIQKN